jgi:hypothetical protein
MKELVDVHFPEAELIRVVLDNLNTHTPGALYQAFEPHEARRILRKLDFHHTPKHGSRLNVAEIEISILSRQVLTRSWTQRRNALKATIDWQFDISKARAKLAHLYP